MRRAVVVAAGSGMPRRAVAIGLLLAFTAGVTLSTRVFAFPTAMSSSRSHPSLRTRPAPLQLREHGNILAWHRSSRGGALPLSSAGSVSICSAASLNTSFWTTVPSMEQQMAGVDVTNVSSTACTLPEFPTAVGLASANGAAVVPVPLPAPDGTQSDSDFLNYGSAHAPGWPSSGIPPDPAPLLLAPSGTAVLVLFTTLPPLSTGSTPTTCISTPPAGYLTISIGSNLVEVAMPSTFLPGPPFDPSGSPFVSCQAVVVSPFLTWSEAQLVVGAPVPQTSTGSLPISNPQLYVNAP